MANTTYRKLFEHTYSNGNRVVVYDSGVSIWDDNSKKWVIDASCIEDDSEIRVGQTQYKRHRPAVKMSSLYKSQIKSKKR